MSIDIKRLETSREYWDSVAPAWATKYCTEANGFHAHQELHDCCIARPQPEWDGEGYAEVGQKVSYNNGQFFEASTVIGRHQCWLWLQVPSRGLITVQQVESLVQPIRTPGHRQKDQAIDRAFYALSEFKEARQVLGDLYDAGLLRLEPKT